MFAFLSNFPVFFPIKYCDLVINVMLQLRNCSNILCQQKIFLFLFFLIIFLVGKRKIQIKNLKKNIWTKVNDNEIRDIRERR